jgi:hypothetical protein
MTYATHFFFAQPWRTPAYREEVVEPVPILVRDVSAFSRHSQFDAANRMAAKPAIASNGGPLLMRFAELIPKLDCPTWLIDDSVRMKRESPHSTSRSVAYEHLANSFR